MKSILFITFHVACFSTAFLQAELLVLDKIAIENLNLELASVEERKFESTIFAIGRLEEIPSNKAVLSSRIAGKVIQLLAFEGDHVEKDQLLVVIESRQMGNPPPSIELRAPRSGVIVSSHIRLGEPVEPSVEMMDIVDRSTLWAVAQIPEQSAALVHQEAKARIRISSLGEKNMESVLLRFGVHSDPNTSTVEGIFPLKNIDLRMLPGMRVEFSVIVSARESVLSIPTTAIQGDPTQRVVFVEDFNLPHAFSRTPVVLGEENDQYIEVKNGLFPGDQVVTRGSYALNFSSASSGMSLKEALDAAHGHEHNEDGSEISPEQKKNKKSLGNEEIHPHDQDRFNLGLLIYAIIVSLLYLSKQFFGSKSKVMGK